MGGRVNGMDGIGVMVEGVFLMRGVKVELRRLLGMRSGGVVGG